MLLKKILLYAIIIIIIYYLLLLLSFRKKTNINKYLDINNDTLTFSHFESQLSHKVPIIIWNNNIHIDIIETLFKIQPSFIIKKKIINNFYNDNLVSYHNVDRLFIIAKESVSIELYTPNNAKKLKYIGILDNKHIYNYKINNMAIDNIKIDLEPNDILYVPRFWLFNVSKKNVDLILYSTVLSVLSTFQT